jgi:plasmid stabilization system protein ParE
MGRPVVLTRQAERDLTEIVRYIARDNPVAAERFGLALLTRANGARLEMCSCPSASALLYRLSLYSRGSANRSVTILAQRARLGGGEIAGHGKLRSEQWNKANDNGQISDSLAERELTQTDVTRRAARPNAG